MLGRVTQQTVQASSLRNLQSNLSRMAALQAQMSSGTKLSLPSDDPSATSDVMRLNASSRQLDQFSRNASDGTSWLTTIDTALSSTTTALQRARDLTVQGGNGAYGTTSRQALATEIAGIRDDLLKQANTTFLGRTVFAGTSNTGAAYTVGTDASGNPTYTFNGVATSSVQRQVGTDTQVRVDSDGSAVFGNGSSSVFATLDGIAATLNAGGDPTSQLADLDKHLNAVTNEAASVGSRQRVLDASTADLTSASQTVKTQTSGLQDIDLAAVIMQLKSQEVAYQGALGATGRVLQPTLMDFLK
ncbi:MAG: flagellar hook-associated protein 3 [Cellulomonas sp. 73-145]|nr:flagellar hook-associated protein FlgL [Cellulomonas sp.]OJV60023.1 MAG: flagellar hook-associated protein 3 [Cellulomonas sp. 73-145]